MQGHVLAADADPAASEDSVADQSLGDELSGGRRDREADALGGKDDGSIHADHCSGRVHQRAAGIARIERSIGLDDVVEQSPGRAAHRAPQSADDARGYGVLEAVWASDGDRYLTNAHAGRIAEPPVGESVRADLDHRQVGVRIVANQLAVDGASVGECRLQRAGTAGNVAVGDQIAVGCDDESGARALTRLSPPAPPLDANVHDRRTHPGHRRSHCA